LLLYLQAVVCKGFFRDVICPKLNIRQRLTSL
jgi:hypothetical protein